MTSEKKKTARSASSSKKNAGRKNVQSGRKNNSAGTSRSTEQEFSINDDVKIISGFVLMLLLIFSNFHATGMVGDYISYFMFGMFGLFAYIMPVLIFAVVCFYLANRDHEAVMKKIVAGIVLLLMFSAVLQLIYCVVESDFAIRGLYTGCARIRNGGGLLGGLLAIGIHAVFGTVGAFIILFAAIVICLVFISEKSFVGGVKKRGKMAYESAKRERQRRRSLEEPEEDSEEEVNFYRPVRKKREKEKLVRARKRVRGVSFSKVTDENEVDADIHELVDSGVLYGELETQEEPYQEEPYQEEPFQKEAFQYEAVRVLDQSPESVDVEQESDEEQWEPDMDYIVPDIDKILGKNRNKNEDVIAGSMEKKEDVRDGEFQPKERIEVSKEAREVMKRPAYSGTMPVKRQVAEIPNEIPSPDVDTGKMDTRKQPAPRTNPLKSKKYIMPPLSLLRKGNGFRNSSVANSGKISETALKLQQTLNAFGVKATVINESHGPSVTRYELQPETGTKVSKITSLSDDIKLNLAASDIRIEAPIPGKAAVGIEVPNAKRESVFLRDLIESPELSRHSSKLAFAAGMDIAGKVVVADIAKMPHMLIAGTTGSGKSVFTNSIIMSILFRAKPTEVKLIIVDPKVVEFGVYNGIPHLLAPVVTDPRKAAGALNWAVSEMSERYKLFAEYNVRDLKGYNEKVKQMNHMDGDKVLEEKPQILIIIDELADLMMVAAKEVEGAICRLAQLARAAGIHLIIATQRPSVDVVTGLIKANIPSRVALLVSSGTDSRTIIDCNGGEKLLGNGDMLFYPSGYVKPVRLQGAFVSDEEVQGVVRFLIDNNQDVTYNESIANADLEVSPGESTKSGDDDGRDVLFEQAARFVIEKEKGSTSMLQRMFKIGFNRAARIIDQLEQAGIVGSDEGTKPRKVLMSMEEFEQFLSSGNGA